MIISEGGVTLHCGDCLDALRTMPDNSLDSCVTDPPYHLTSIVRRFGADGAAPAQFGTDGAYARASRGFMGKSWDGGDIAFRVELWAEVLRVLKPGGYVVAFSGTRTQHRMVVAIEDAGFEIRDQLAWVYGSGFPKSLDISKAIDKTLGGQRELVAPRSVIAHQRNIGNRRPYMDDPNHMTVGDEPVTDAAKQWRGWGTALKPAWEPICLARKPLIGTNVENVLAWGTGALNIDSCRIGTEDQLRSGASKLWSHYRNGEATADKRYSEDGGTNFAMTPGPRGGDARGRFPANVLHDGSDEVLAAFPQSRGQLAAVGPQHGVKNSVNVYGDYGPREDFQPRGDGGSAARFFYAAKASKADRAGSKHPTVKPIALMQWLCRLVTPSGGVVLDPFAGSGTTGAAALAEGFSVVLCERETEYQADIRRRLNLPGPDEPDFMDIGPLPDSMDLGGAGDEALPDFML